MSCKLHNVHMRSIVIMPILLKKLRHREKKFPGDVVGKSQGQGLTPDSQAPASMDCSYSPAVQESLALGPSSAQRK